MKYLRPILALQPLQAISCLLIVVSSSSLATPSETPNKTDLQSHEEIHQLVENHVKQKVDQQLFEPTIQMRKLSPELKLPACKVPLELVDNRAQKVAGRMTIRIVCAQPKWQVFVPVTVDGKKPLVISAKAIFKRAVITSEDVKQIYVPYKQIPTGVLIDVNKAIGMKAKRAIGANQPIKARDLQPPYWVIKNKIVNVVTKIGDIEVRTKGTALKSGVIDEQIPVENLKTKKVVNGIVIAPNTVLIP